MGYLLGSNSEEEKRAVDELLEELGGEAWECERKSSQHAEAGSNELAVYFAGKSDAIEECTDLIKEKYREQNMEDGTDDG